MSAIQSEGLEKSFGDIDALKGLDLDIEAGELYGFLGPNGAGKSTTINILTGQLRPDSGSAEVMGIDPVENPKKVRKRVGILPEREDPPSFLTPREYFEFVAEIRGIGNLEERIDEWAERLEFEDKLDVLNADLSKGEKQKVMVTQAFLHRPDLVFIDEPLINLDPVMQERLKQFFVEYRDQGNTLFISTHVLELAEEICSRVGIVRDGELVEETDVESLDSLVDEFLDEVE